jgi:HAD superfamily hydrolase (TIGR01509 family)
MIKALIFDFDGLIVDTELPDYESWQRVYAGHGVDLPVEKWGQIVGGTAASDFDPHSYLEELTGLGLDREDVWLSRRKQYLDGIAEQPILPGVLSYLDDAERMGLKIGVASSSPENWVRGHLARLGIYQRFHAIKTADDVKRTKPDPELYVAVVKDLGVSGRESVAFEDSPNGIKAAKEAGLFCVAVPNPLTAQLPLGNPDLQLTSLEEMRLGDLLLKIHAS